MHRFPIAMPWFLSRTKAGLARFVLCIYANYILLHCLFEYDTAIMLGKARHLEVT